MCLEFSTKKVCVRRSLAERRSKRGSEWAERVRAVTPGQLVSTSARNGKPAECGDRFDDGRLPRPVFTNEEGYRRSELDVEAANDGQTEWILLGVDDVLLQVHPNEVRRC